MQKEQTLEQWTEENEPIGKLLGYPDCCIKEFCNMPPKSMKGVPSEDMVLKLEAGYMNHQFTGFIPCLEHARKIKSGQITLESLIDHKKRAENEEYFIAEFPNAMN